MRQFKQPAVTKRMTLCLVLLAVLVFVQGWAQNIADQAYQNGGPNPFAQNYYGQCTWYCWGRAYEKLGIRIVFKNSAGEIPNSGRDAGNWLSITPDLPNGTTPIANSIAVWV